MRTGKMAPGCSVPTDKRMTAAKSGGRGRVLMMLAVMVGVSAAASTMVPPPEPPVFREGRPAVIPPPDKAALNEKTDDVDTDASRGKGPALQTRQQPIFAPPPDLAQSPNSTTLRSNTLFSTAPHADPLQRSEQNKPRAHNHLHSSILQDLPPLPPPLEEDKQVLSTQHSHSQQRLQSPQERPPPFRQQNYYQSLQVGRIANSHLHQNPLYGTGLYQQQQTMPQPYYNPQNSNFFSSQQTRPPSTLRKQSIFRKLTNTFDERLSTLDTVVLQRTKLIRDLVVSNVGELGQRVARDQRTLPRIGASKTFSSMFSSKAQRNDKGEDWERENTPEGHETRENGGETSSLAQHLASLITSSASTATSPANAVVGNDDSDDDDDDNNNKDTPQRKSTSGLHVTNGGASFDNPSRIRMQSPPSEPEQRNERPQQHMGAQQESTSVRVDLNRDIRQSSSHAGRPSGFGGADPAMTSAWPPGTNRPLFTSPVQQQQPQERRPYSFNNEDDNEGYDGWSKKDKGGIKRLFSSIPSPKSFIPKFRFRRSFRVDEGGWSDDDDDDDAFRAKTAAGRSKHKPAASSTLDNALRNKERNGSLSTNGNAPFPIADLMSRRMTRTRSAQKMTGGANLLTLRDIRRCNSIGRGKAVLDVVCLGFLLAALKEILPHIPSWTGRKWEASMNWEDVTTILPVVWETLVSSTVESWAPFALAAAILSAWTNHLVFYPMIKSTARQISQTVKFHSTYAQLYLRLVSAIPVKKHIPDLVELSARKQVFAAIEFARLGFFATLVISALLFATVAAIQPIIQALGVAVIQLFTLDAVRHWPVAWGELGEGIKMIFIQMSHTLAELIVGEFRRVAKNPVAIVVQTCLFSVMVAASWLPKLERNRVSAIVEMKKGTSSAAEDDDDDEEVPASMDAVTVSDMGISSATRLGLFAQDGAVECTLERWRIMQPQNGSLSATNYQSRLLSVQLRKCAYALLSAMLLSVPLVVHCIIPAISFVGNDEMDSAASSTKKWGRAFGMVVLLLFTQRLTSSAISYTVESNRHLGAVSLFLKELAGTLEEISSARKNLQADLQLSATASPSKGLVVSDLWAAHVTKRAWALRGASIVCRNGEVVLVIGNDGSGKSRLLTAIAESIITPPRRARSLTPARGSVSVGGVEVAKWDKAQLRRRLGLVLNDVRSVADIAELLSGSTLEEILEPICGVRQSMGPQSNPGAAEKSAIAVAMQVTGLSASLLPRLPSKLSTVVTSSEDELTPSPLRPPSQVLSPAEWSKLLLTKSLAQSIISNDNPMSAPNTVARCLIGSVLLLDDVTVNMSEMDEATLIKALRSTGAATLMTSKRWASGRFADRIAVMRDGVIVETGSHAELLAKGPQRSIYAAKWIEMTSI